MGTSFAAVQACCPLCGSPVLSVASGKLIDEEVYTIQLGALGRGYSLCDECGILADLPGDVTLN